MELKDPPNLVAAQADGTETNPTPAMDLDLDQSSPTVDTKATGSKWTIAAGERPRMTPSLSPSHEGSTTVFIGGLADATRESDLMTDLKARGIGIRACHQLPKSDQHPDCVAFKAFVGHSDVARIKESSFWPKGIWCRLWRHLGHPDHPVEDVANADQTSHVQ